MVSQSTSPELNIIVNQSIILMSVMMGGLTKAIVSMTGAVGGAMAGGMTAAFEGEKKGQKVAKKIQKEVNQKLPEVDTKVNKVIANMRKDLYTQLEQKKKQIQPLLSDPAFKKGPAIVNKYDFGLPKLTQELDDATLSKYVALLLSEDPKFTKMYKELMDWMNSLPKPPEDKLTAAKKESNQEDPDDAHVPKGYEEE